MELPLLCLAAAAEAAARPEMEEAEAAELERNTALEEEAPPPDSDEMAHLPNRVAKLLLQ